MNEAQRHLLRQQLLLAAKPDLRRGEITDATPGAVEIALGGADESVPAELIAGGLVAVGDIVDALVAGNAPPLILAATVAPLTAATLNADWSTGTGRATASYYIDRGRVWLQGGVKRDSGATTTPLTLPSGYRPTQTGGVASAVVTGAGTLTYLTITTAGVLTFGAVTTGTAINLDGISFRI